MLDAPPARLPPLPASLRFGPLGRFELQTVERRLLVDGQAAALGGRALDVLMVLAAQPDHLVSKNELLDRAWPGLIVEEANLQVQISNLRKVLGGGLIATVPGRGYRFTAAVDGADTALAAPAPKLNVPTGTLPRLFGRDADLAHLEEMLPGDGCVTLVGPSGVGKTSLARAAAARWPRGVVWVDLASLTQGQQVAGALARELGAPLAAGDPTAQLQQALKDQVALVVLDNAEHLVEACARLAASLRALAGVTLLVTSQLPLAVAGERVLRLGPLALTTVSAEGPMPDGALALLADRVAAADHRFRPSADTWPILAQICTQLDGLPLALEMAAARVPSIGLQGVRDALSQRFALLTRGRRDAATRHQTLHNALDWSHQLLGDAERRLFRALGVFSGGFTLDLAVALMTDEADARWDVIDTLAALVDRSLVVASADDPPRYRLLESVRAYALEQLQQAGATAETRRRHARALAALLARHLPGNAATAALCEVEMPNTRDAVEWARSHDLALAAQLTAGATTATTFSVWRHEATEWLLSLQAAMEGPEGTALAPSLQAAWWVELARMTGIRGDPTAAAAARRGLELWRPLNRPDALLRAALVWVRSVSAPGAELDAACAELSRLSASVPDLTLQQRFSVQAALTKAALTRGDAQAVLEGRLAELEMAQAMAAQDQADAADCNVVDALNRLGRHDEAAQRGTALLRRIDGDPNGADNGNLPWVFSGLIAALVACGQLEPARTLVPRAFAAGRRFGAWPTLVLLPGLAVAQRRFAAAARLAGYVRRCAAQRWVVLDAGDDKAMDAALSAASAALGRVRVEALLKAGAGLDSDAALALAAGTEP